MISVISREEKNQSFSAIETVAAFTDSNEASQYASEYEISNPTFDCYISLIPIDPDWPDWLNK